MNHISNDTVEKVYKFRDDRDWKQFHNPKDLAISISLEAAELLETFQWSGSDCYAAKKREKIKEELADVLIYSILMAEACDLNMDDIINTKLQVNNSKYPKETSSGRKTKYTEL